MSFITDVFTAARGGIKERDERIANLEKQLESMTDSRAYFRRERDACLELVKESGEKYAELEAQVRAAEESARQFAAEFELPVPGPPVEQTEPVEDEGWAEVETAPAEEVP